MAEDKILPITDYGPDLPGIPGNAATITQNVWPRTKVSWGAMPSLMPISTALPTRAQGMATFLAKGGDVNLFAGDSSKLYHVGGGGGGYTWADVSRPLGYAGPDPNTLWEFTSFNDQCLATDFNDAIQVYNLTGGGTFNDLSVDAPKARHIAVIKNSFVMVGNTTDGVNGHLPQRLWWCAAGDASNWPTPGGITAAEFQAGAFDLLGDKGDIESIRTELTSADGLVFQRDSLRRIIYQGPPGIFDFLPAQNARGTYSPNGPVVVGGICYFPAYDGFYSCDGAVVTPMGADRVDKTFLDDLDATYYSNVYGAADPVRRMVWWAYPGSGNTMGIPNRMLGYSWQYDKWVLVNATIECISRMFGIGYTLDELYTILGYTLDNLPAPLDSPLWQGGLQVLGIFDANHKLSFFTGSAMAATVETSEMEIYPGQRAFIKGVRPIVDGTNVQVPTVSIQHREVQESVATATPYVPINGLGVAGLRTSGRYVRASISIPAGGDWTHISGAALDTVPAGQR